ncbi:hypothetical protein N824_29635 [Pedobacter sp. V48]|nr:hypothetical protein N824_29635 [Pedobacter sp. V48]
MIMENYSITISRDKQVHHFEIGEYLHHNGESCKVKVFQEGRLVASFEPDDYAFLHICQNPGKLEEELLHLLADQIEAHHPHGINKDLNREI